MAERFYDVTLLSDVALTEDGATTGGHKGQDYLRGSLFLGVVASRMGKNFDADLLLSGRVRFLNAYPLIEGEMAFPMPFYFHKIKSEEWEGKPPCLSPEEAPEKQLQQWRSGYLTPSGTVLEMPLKSRMKTAVDRTSRNSKEGQLFGYQHIPGGMRFRMGIQADSQEDLNTVAELLGEGEVFLGRSRFAEYGAVRISCSENKGVLPEPKALKGKVFLYLVSDLVLSRDGQMVLMPSPEDFGLSGVHFAPEKSFMRFRRYAPWNSFFNCRMEERQALCKGSVLVFDVAEGAPDVKELQKHLASGVGLYTQEGLGQIWVNPSWLIEPPVLKKIPEKASVSAPKRPETPLVRFLQRKRALRKDNEESLQLGLKWAKEWVVISDALIKEYDEAPTNSQWSNLRGLALEHAEDPGVFMHELKEFCTKDLRRKLWVDSKVMYKGKLIHLYEAITDKLGKNPEEKDVLALHHAAVEMGRLLLRPKSESDNHKKGGSQA